MEADIFGEPALDPSLKFGRSAWRQPDAPPRPILIKGTAQQRSTRI